MNNPWLDILRFPLGKRFQKPRKRGLTMVIDKGLGLRALRDLLETSGNYVDFLKLGFGTSVLYNNSILQAKMNLCRQYDVQIYPGGTLMEIALLQGRYESFLEKAKSLGFKFIEISDGTIPLDSSLRQYCIKRALSEGFKVLTEVGKKDPAGNPPISQLMNQGLQDLSAGAWKVIIEARESGKGIGIFDKSGGTMEEALNEIVRGFGETTDIIWEAPLKSQQVDMILRFGPEVNLGNIQPNELLALEALRCGLRGDTFRLVVPPPEMNAIPL